MAFQISGTTVIDNSRKGIFNSMNPGSFASASRPGSPSVGDIIYNNTEGKVQTWNGITWV